MLDRLRSRLTYANVTATIALFLALGGGAYAASQLPANSVGTAQIKDHSIRGVDVNKPNLGSVPQAANAAKLGGNLPGAFVKKTDFAGGALSGPFSNLSLDQNTVGSDQVVDDSLSQADIGDYAHVTRSLNDFDSDATPVTTTLETGVTAKCNLSGSNLTATITVTGTNSDWAVSADGPGGAGNASNPTEGTEVKLIEIGPAGTLDTEVGQFVALHSSIPSTTPFVNGLVAVRVKPGGFACDFVYTRFG